MLHFRRNIFLVLHPFLNLRQIPFLPYQLYIFFSKPDQLYAVAEALKTAGLGADSQKLTYVAASSVEVTDETVAAQVLRLIDALEDNDDVQQVHANFDVPDSILARITV